MKETEIWEILVSLSANEISLAEAHDQILRLFDVVGRSEQLFCTCRNSELEKGSLLPVFCHSCNAYVQNDR